MEVEQETVLALLPDVRELTVLDAGCGSGRYLRVLGDRGANAIGMDLSPAMLERARETTTRIARADLRALPFDAMSFDLVVCGLALGDVAEIELALTEIARVLRSGGGVVYSVVHPAGGAAGWSRTFESGGRQWAIDSFWHSADRHREACASAGLVDRGMAENPPSSGRLISARSWWYARGDRTTCCGARAVTFVNAQVVASRGTAGADAARQARPHRRHRRRARQGRRSRRSRSAASCSRA